MLEQRLGVADGRDVERQVTKEAVHQDAEARFVDRPEAQLPHGHDVREDVEEREEDERDQDRLR